MYEFHEDHLASYAVRSIDSAGRRYQENDDPLRSPFELDRHRIIVSTAFRRLNGKTQVFAPSLHDHFRSRLTHTLEVAQIARLLANLLHANEYLAETITLAHDLGHPPFGHAGEFALNAMMADHGGFNHNTHSLRVVDYLEHPFPPFRGLNLTHETRAGLMTHETPHDIPESVPNNGILAQAPDKSGFHTACGSEDVQLTNTSGPSVEAQIASIADRIAYNLHDLEDAIGADIIQFDSLNDLTLWHDACKPAADQYKDKSIHAIRRIVLDAMLHEIFSDILETSRNRLSKISSAHMAAASSTMLVTSSQKMEQQWHDLERFLMEQVYRNPQVKQMDDRGREMIEFLFDAYRDNPDLMQSRFTARIKEQNPSRVICDYIAGMTDRYCKDEYSKLSHQS